MTISTLPQLTQLAIFSHPAPSAISPIPTPLASALPSRQELAPTDSPPLIPSRSLYRKDMSPSARSNPLMAFGSITISPHFNPRWYSSLPPPTPQLPNHPLPPIPSPYSPTTNTPFPVNSLPQRPSLHAPSTPTSRIYQTIDPKGR